MDRLGPSWWKHGKGRLYRNNALPIALFSAVVFPIAAIPVVLNLIVVVEFSTVVVALPPMIVVVELRFILLALGVAVVSAVVVAFRRRWRRFAPCRR